MTRRVLTAAVATGLAALLVPGAWAGDSALKQKAQKMYDHASQMFAKKDIKNLSMGFADDFTSKSKQGVLNKKQMIAMMKEMFATTSNVRVSMKVLSATRKGKLVTVKSYSVWKGTTKDEKGVPHEMVYSGSSTEIWDTSGKHWKMKSMVDGNDMKMTMDGKPFDPTAPPSGK